jgi:clan AA aspartic protease
MGLVYEHITLKNAVDVVNAVQQLVKAEDVRTVTVRAMVDTGALMLVINDDLCTALGLQIARNCKVSLAGEETATAKITAPVEVHWHDRTTTCQALVMPGSGEILLGAIPLEGMDLMVDPVNQTLVGIHGDEVVCVVK